MAAMTFLASGEQASAVEHLLQLVRAQPGAGRPRVVLAALLARQGATEEARRIALQLEREDPSSPEAALAVALAEGRGAGRSPTLDRLLSRNPEGSEAVAQLMAEIAQGRWVHPARPDTTQVEPIMPAPRPSTRPSTRPASRPAARPGARPRVLFLVGQGAEPDEFGMPFEALYAMGYAIDVASPALEVQKLMSGRGNFKDPMPHLTLEQVDVDHYLGLVLPGGNSPGHLEVFPRSAEICRAFMRAGKPVSAICHGPRLLMRAGVLRDRVATCLFTVPNELADQWVAGDYGVYLDQPVVIDRALTTSRYPYDLLPFTRATIHQLAKAGGIPPVGPARVLLIAPGAGRNDLWVLREVPAMCGMEVTSPAADQMPAAVAAADQGFDLLLIANTSGQKREAFAPHARLVEAFAAAHKPVVLVGDTGLNDAEPIAYDRPRALAALVAAARRTPRGQAPAEVVPTVVPPLAAFATPTRKDRYQAAVALRQGFDDAVVAATIAWLQGRRKDVLVLGVEEKPMRGVNGLTLTPMGRYTDQPALAPDAVIIVPGSFWPEKKESRQATQPAWIEQQEAQDDARMKWLLAARQRGATLVVFGMDSMRMAAHPQFKGKKFAGTDQAFWAFSKAGAAYADAKALVSDTRLITAKGAYTVDAALALLGGE